MLIDLQLHSTYSDGYLTPSQLVDFLSANNIKTAALTDHNTVGGLNEFRQACLKNKIKPIVGMELYVKLNNIKFNLLWYNFNENHPALHKILRLSQIRRRNQMRRALLKIKKLGLTFNENKILDKYGHYIPLNHIVEDIWQIAENRRQIALGIGVKNPRQHEIISHFFKNEKVNQLRECYINLNQVLKLRKQIGGQLILNHPGKNNRLDKTFIAKLKKLNLDGMEVISPHHTIGAVIYAQYLAKQFKLIMTGGSDYHKNEPGEVAIKNAYAYFKINSKYLEGIDKIIG
ncbi:PHP domain-containing protein [Patescibacteria group bacterium]|nr:PHP domain-containing protein [Patescibacteria group bacterium]MBU1663004.1 PHP domain-containing protein [Patescibacteria group bacterium]MBU1934172.1 PHP domain-containing protein [Patescibacteria group bacterium]MBU2233603.1 PHP domain-containing protein [Patescibacteria group bacterium]MBU2264132.1 PHP domain-containing protein [Patescibacteria group bacterium]